MQEVEEALLALQKKHGVRIKAVIENEYIKGYYPYEWILEKPIAKIVIEKIKKEVKK